MGIEEKQCNFLLFKLGEMALSSGSIESMEKRNRHFKSSSYSCLRDSHLGMHRIENEIISIVKLKTCLLPAAVLPLSVE